MKRKILKISAFILMFQIILQMSVPVVSEAITGTSDSRFEYTVNSDKTSITITKYVGTDTEVIIPSSIDGYKVTSIGYSSFHNCIGLTSIEIPNSVTTIEGYAFSGCYGLKSITIPNSVTSIGYWAFLNCSSLTSIKIPEGVTIMGANIFNGCTNLTDIILPEGVITIEIGAFYNCKSLVNINIPSSVTIIGKNSFNGCSNLTNITIPEEVMIIENNAFGHCENLIIKCKSNSTAHQHAVENNIKYTLDDVGPELIVEYRPTNPTNQNVEVTIKSNEELRKIENWTLSEDKMNLTKTYTANGSEDVKIKDLVGNEISINVKIANIDRTAPKIEGVEDGGIYSSVTPKVTDENLNTVVITKDGQEVSYINGNTIEEKGSYILTATDKAGNSTKVTFTIIEILKIESTKYTIDESNKYILGIKVGETKENIRANITTNIEYKIITKDGKEVTTEKIGTGMKIEFTTGESYEIVVKGDVNGDGKISTTDITKLKKHIIQKELLQGCYEKAGNINGDSKISVTDLANMKKVIVGLITL